jgi:hypothetical protein
MGRYYYGDIEGKYEFGVQSTDCMVEYGAFDDGNILCFGSCSCYVENEDDGTAFCSDCFETRDEHLEAINEESDGSVSLTTYETDECRFIMTRDRFEKSKSFIEKHKDSTDRYIIADVMMLTEIRTFFEENPDATECRWVGEC